MLDVTILSRDKEFSLEGRVGREISERMGELHLDTYNSEYVIRVTVDVVDPSPPQKSEEDDEYS